MNEKRTALEWVMLALCAGALVLVFMVGCVMIPASPIYMQFGGHANAAANTGEHGLQRQGSAADVPTSEVEAAYGVGHVKARQAKPAPASQPTTQPTGKPNP